ncbi:MAG TPA: tRNA (adenosine(37)-N6)-threonylcarbamoyltransferase complex dimerization subunit type 1 TsaB [Syntrophomonadaceae bacterium]|nr:tRNA (adenosine(37)-N6)-threonylcarbamoyltransferase complex dimerization subunit type 1 TsaB [Syntrophomonadaceae bacterium]
MLILAIDSATPCAGVALVNKEKVLYEESANFKRTHSEILMPMVDRAFKTCECSLDDVSAIAVTVGPGSFTGLRIGMGTVKGLGLGSGKPIIVVSTLETIAFNLSGHQAMVGVLLDARKQEVYSSIYDVSGKFPSALTDEQAISPEGFVELALEMKEKQSYSQIILLGDGYYPYQDYFKSAFGKMLIPTPSHLMLPRAGALGNLAINKADKGEFTDVFALKPIYLRLSEAEYKLKKGAL